MTGNPDPAPSRADPAVGQVAPVADRGNRLLRRGSRFRWAIVAVILVVVFGGGWFAARQFQSPAQREAAARPPTPGPLYVPIEQGVLSDQVSGSGTVSYERLDALTTGHGGVVTAQPSAAGSTIQAGGVIIEIESQPVFLFTGRFPFFRDLAPGDRGRDVSQLQSGLRAAGHPVPQGETGTYGAGTAQAVKALYAAAGYPAPAGFPAADLSVASSLPATVFQVPAVGSRLDSGGTLGTVAHGGLVARATLDGAAFVRVSKGLRADVVIDNGTPTPGQVATLIPQGAHSDPQVTVAFAAPPRGNLAGHPVVVTITIEAAPSSGLIVPTRALSDDAHGGSQVILKSGADRRSVPVRVIGSLNGRSVIEPADGSAGSLQAGDLVQVG